MKKAVLAPLCSAFVIPGLGQVINQHIKKGVILLAVDFILIILFTIKMYQIIREVVESEVLNTGEPKMIMEQTLAGDHASLIFLFMAFGLLWLYSVVDAFWGGSKADELERFNEKLPDR